MINIVMSYGTTIKINNPSTFGDFKQIVSVIMYFLNYELHFFGASVSIFNAVFSILILSVAITSVIKIFIGD